MTLCLDSSCSEFFSRPWELRLGVLALIAASHLVDDWAMESYEGNASRNDMARAISEARRRLVAEHPDLEVLADAADAAEHGKLAAIVARSRHIGGADDPHVTPSRFQAPFAEGRFAEAMDLYFEAPDGRRIAVRRLLSEVLGFWRAKLAC